MHWVKTMLLYARFTDRARKVMQLANQEAQRLNHEYVGTEHILLGLAKEEQGVGGYVLKNLGLDMAKILSKIEKAVARSDGITPAALSETPQVKQVITEYVVEERRNLNHNYAGTEHLLLALLRDPENEAAQLLVKLGLKLEDVRREVLNVLGHG
jgi:ATP-dependent Clp protease ATP-binding subunit ClpC